MGKFAEKLAAKSPNRQRGILGNIHSLVQSNRSDDLVKYYKLLTDFDFLAAKIQHPEFGVQGLITDYDLIDDPKASSHPEYNPEKVKTLKLIQGALRLSAHVLAKDKTQLVEQLWGRMQCFDMPEIKELLSQASQNKTTWLRPLTPSLTSPSGSLLRTLAGHSRRVNAVALTPDGKKAISGSDDHTLKVWNLETGELVQTLAGHSRRVNAVALTADGKTAISGSDDHTLKVWNLETGELVQTLAGHSGGVYAVALTADGQTAISGSYDNTLKVWHLETGELVQTLAGHSGGVNAVALTADGQTAISGSGNKTLKVWNQETGVRAVARSLWLRISKGKVLAGHSGSVNAVALTADGQTAISGSDDNTLKVWNLETRKLVQTLAGHSGRVRAVALTADGQTAISGSWDNTLKVWNLETGKLVQTLAGHSLWVNAVALTADGKTAISGSDDNTLKVWNLETGVRAVARSLWLRISKGKVLAGHSGSVNAVALTADGQTAISGSDDNTLKVWNLETRKLVQTLAGHSGRVRAVALTADGQTAISGSWDNTLKVWNLETGKLVQTLAGHSLWVNAVALTADGKTAISGSDDNTLKVWNLETGEAIASFSGESPLLCCAVARDGVTIVAGEASGRVHFLRLEGNSKFKVQNYE